MSHHQQTHPTLSTQLVQQQPPLYFPNAREGPVPWLRVSVMGMAEWTYKQSGAKEHVQRHIGELGLAQHHLTWGYRDPKHPYTVVLCPGFPKVKPLKHPHWSGRDSEWILTTARGLHFSVQFYDTTKQQLTALYETQIDVSRYTLRVDDITQAPLGSYVPASAKLARGPAFPEEGDGNEVHMMSVSHAFLIHDCL
ncbi:hypothetical protein T439DRAFT_360655 [Meredithblackwellia eburnea MCA 4105]